MKTYSVTEELLIEAHKEACDKWKKRIEEVAPELFKPKFKVGDWLYLKSRGLVGRVFKKCDTFQNCWGLDINGNRDNDSCHEDNLRLATSSEILSHLKKIADEKGFVKGCRYKSISGGEFTATTSELKYGWLKMDSLYFDTTGGGLIYLDGKWGEVISQPEVLISMDEIASKFGVDIKHIKIQK